MENEDNAENECTQNSLQEILNENLINGTKVDK